MENRLDLGGQFRNARAAIFLHCFIYVATQNYLACVSHILSSGEQHFLSRCILIWELNIAVNILFFKTVSHLLT